MTRDDASVLCSWCAAPSQLYLCEPCISLLAAALQLVTPDLLGKARLIARGQASPASTTARPPGGKAGPSMPADIQLLDTVRELETLDPDPREHALNPALAAAAEHREKQIRWLDQHVYGTDTKGEHAVNQYRLAAAGLKDPMTPEQAEQAILNATGHRIKAKQIRKWHERGSIAPTARRPLRFLPSVIYSRYLQSSR